LITTSIQVQLAYVLLAAWTSADCGCLHPWLGRGNEGIYTY